MVWIRGLNIEHVFVCVCFLKQGPEGKPGMQGLPGIDGPLVSIVIQNH